MTSDCKAFVKRFVRKSKSDPYVDEVELINVNPTYAEVRYPNGHEATVSIRDLAPCPQEQNNDVRPNNESFAEHDITLQNLSDSTISADHENETSLSSELNESLCSKNLHNNSVLDEGAGQVRRSTRSNKGVPPLRYRVNC